MAKIKKKEIIADDPVSEIGSMDESNNSVDTVEFNKYPWEVKLELVEEPIVRIVKREGISHIVTSFIKDENLLKMCCELMYEMNPKYLSNIILIERSISRGKTVNGYYIRELALAHIGLVGMMENFLKHIRNIKKLQQNTLRASLWQETVRVIAGVLEDEGEQGAENMSTEMMEKMLIQGKCCQMFDPEGPVEKMIQTLVDDVANSVYAEEAKVFIAAHRNSKTCLAYSIANGKEMALNGNFRLWYKNKNGLKGGEWDKEPQAPEQVLKFTRPEPSVRSETPPTTTPTPLLQQLKYIITHYGCSVIYEPRRCMALLKDLCPEHKREVNVLVSALKEDIPHDLLSMNASMPAELTLSRLRKRLYDDLGIAEEFSHWAVETWKLALEIASQRTDILTDTKQFYQNYQTVQTTSGKNSKNNSFSIQLRATPITVSRDDFKEVFQLYDNRTPVQFIQNDYVDNRDDTIVDRITGLMWEQSGSQEYMIYDNGLEYINNLNMKRFASYADWHLPTVEELLSLMEKELQGNKLFIQAVFDKKQGWCWSADKHPSGGGWNVDFRTRGVYLPNLGYFSYVRGVRSISVSRSQIYPANTSLPTKSPPSVELRSKPITVSYDDFKKLFKLDDNWCPKKYIQNDYADNGDGTVTDRATGLMWEQSGSKEYLTSEKAKEYIRDLNRKRFAGYSDWRLPTVEELLSLMEKEKQDNDLYIQTVFDKQQRWCWNADKLPSGRAWFVYFNYGIVREPIDENFYVRGVRSL
ncbi:MAG: DUF1566 domain-containing protein [Desulfococcaceae bacterium]